MAQLSDLEAAITAVGAELTRLQTDVTAIVERLKVSGTVPDADVQALATVAASIGASADSIEAAITPKP